MLRIVRVHELDPGVPGARFRRRYVAELDASPETWAPLRDAAAGGDVVLLYAARDREHNNAVVLRDHLEQALGR